MPQCIMRVGCPYSRRWIMAFVSLGVSRLLRQFVNVEFIVQSCILLLVCSSLFRSSREHESARVTILPGVLGVTPLHSTVRMSQCTPGYGETVLSAKD